MTLVPDIQADEQRRNLLENARVFQLSAINSSNPGNLRAESTRNLGRIGIVAADDDVAVEIFVSVEKLSRQIVKRSRHAHALGHKFGGLLRGRSLPHAKRARGAPAHAGSE